MDSQARTDGEAGQAMPETYDFKAIEARWQLTWEERGTFFAKDDDERQKLYVLQMFPYPSGDLHAGHVRNYVLGDALARYWGMKGYNVMHPMGFDSFGLPAEQAAIDKGVQPSAWIADCVANSRRQFRRYGFSFDWPREVVTSDPAYYRWTQWLFLKLHEMGLVYRKQIEVNWCEEHGVLANDEVKDGCCWRCEGPVVKKKLPQWCMRTTDFAQDLLDGIESLPGWTDGVRAMQRNWIGRSEGTKIVFDIPTIAKSVGQASSLPSDDHIGKMPAPPELKPELEVFTTRVDTIFGCTFMAIAPDHPLAEVLAREGGTLTQLERFAGECAREAVEYSVAEEKPKRGIPLGVNCINPFNGEEAPIWATNYVVSGFGTGAVMAVPAHDTRDHVFAKEYGLPIQQVIEPAESRSATVSRRGDPCDRPHLRSPGRTQGSPLRDRQQGRPPSGSSQENGGQGRPPVKNEAYTEKGICINSGQFDGMDFGTAKAAMDKWLAGQDKGGAAVEYRLRDWNMSRQRFWGAPIPMVRCESCGWQPVPQSELPVELPEEADYSDIRVSPLANDEAWQRTECPKCSGTAQRETDTMTTFMDSAWYFLRFCDPHNDSAPFAAEKLKEWMPVDYYVGGKEHAVGHLLYSRFISLVLHKAGVLEFSRPDHEGKLPQLPGEPFRRLFNQGIVYKDGAKMSKSKGNVVSADELADEHGADTARLFAFFGGPADQDLEWTTSGVAGCHRFLKRVWRLARAVKTSAKADPDHCGEQCRAAVRARHAAVAGVTADIEGWRFNTAIAKLMELLNELERQWKSAGGEDSGLAFTAALLAMAQLLSPFAPHIAEEIWQQLGGLGLCCESDWPIHDPDMLLSATMELPVQVNGKVRGRITVASDIDEDACIAAAKADPAVMKWIEGKEVARAIYIPGRMVTLVVE